MVPVRIKTRLGYLRNELYTIQALDLVWSDIFLINSHHENNFSIFVLKIKIVKHTYKNKFQNLVKSSQIEIVITILVLDLAPNDSLCSAKSICKV